MNDEAPRQVSDRKHKLDITGYLSPFYKSGQPVILSMPGTDDLFIGVWSSEELLRKSLGDYGVDFDDIKQIDNMGPFLESLAGMFRVAVDLRKEEDKTRFLEIQNVAEFAFRKASKA